jgi:hypothetical protein
MTGIFLDSSPQALAGPGEKNSYLSLWLSLFSYLAAVIVAVLSGELLPDKT